MQSDSQSAYDQFMDETVPALLQLDEELRIAASAGDLLAVEILDLYRSIYRTFDIATALALSEKLGQWQLRPPSEAE